MKNWLALLTLAALTLPALAQPPSPPARRLPPAATAVPPGPPPHPHAHAHEIILANRTFYIVSCSEKDLLVRCPSMAAAQMVARRHHRETGHRPGIDKE